MFLLMVMLTAGAGPACCQGRAEDPAEAEWDAVSGPEAAVEAARGPAYLSVLDVIGKLTVAVLIAYGLSLAVRWAQQHYPRTNRSSSARSMRLAEVLPLGPDARLYIVVVEGRRLLLAAQGANIHHLADLDQVSPVPSARFSSTYDESGATRDELNIVHAPLRTHWRAHGDPRAGDRSRSRTRPVRSDVVSDQEAWEQRREQLLRDLEDA